MGGGVKLHPAANNDSYTILATVAACAAQFVHSVDWNGTPCRLPGFYLADGLSVCVCVQRTLSSHTIQP